MDGLKFFQEVALVYWNAATTVTISSGKVGKPVSFSFALLCDPKSQDDVESRTSKAVWGLPSSF